MTEQQERRVRHSEARCDASRDEWAANPRGRQNKDERLQQEARRPTTARVGSPAWHAASQGMQAAGEVVARIRSTPGRMSHVEHCSSKTHNQTTKAQPPHWVTLKVLNKTERCTGRECDAERNGGQYLERSR